MKHNVFIIVLTLLLMLSLCSCHSDQPAGCVTTDGNGTTVIPSETTKASDDSDDSVPENALKVRSVYSSKNYLIPGEFDRAYYNSLLYVDSEYYGLYTYTSVINNSLYPLPPNLAFNHSSGTSFPWHQKTIAFGRLHPPIWLKGYPPPNRAFISST